MFSDSRKNKLERFSLVCLAYYVTRHYSPLEGESARQEPALSLLSLSKHEGA